jgi:hypothetical protein
MRRRDLLAVVGTAGALSAAGCVGYETTDAGVDGDDSNQDTDDGRDGDGTTQPDTVGDDTGAGDGVVSPDGEPVERIPIGDRDGVPFPDNNRPHGVSVVNDAADARNLRVLLDRDGERVLDRVVEVPAGQSVALTLNQPGGHDLGVGVDGRLVDRVTIQRDLFDCNDSTTTVTVDEQGGVTSTTISTEVACPGPEVAGTALEHGQGTCGGTDEASVATDGERVRVSGTVRTPVPCYDLALSGVELVDTEAYGGRDGTLVVTVTTAGRQDGACVECVGSVPYETTVDMTAAFPETVRVVHLGLSGERTVTEATLD